MTGALYLPTGSGFDTTTNYFDSTQGFVPLGYGNSTSTTVTIADPAIEFAFLQGGGTVAVPGIDSITVDISSSTLIVSELINYTGGLSGFELVFTDPAFSGLSVAESSDDFAMGGLTGSLVGDTLTLTVAADCLVGTGCTGWPPSQTAGFSFSGSGPTPVPEPTSLALLGTLLSGFGAARWRRPRMVL